jgi:hypothetical protein
MFRYVNTNDPKLIEEAAKAIYVERWGSGAGWERGSRKPYRKQARAALAVFEKAHTPTDDEREALLRAMRAGWAKRQEWWTTTEAPADAPTNDEFLADAILTAGFRRSEVPEPSACASCLGMCGGGRHCCENCEHAEPQGEPSDAQARAFVDAEWEHRFVVFNGGWACRCGWDIPGSKLTTDEASERHWNHQIRAALRAALRAARDA